MPNQPEQLGPYRITRKLGEGAMGAVYQGVDNDGLVVAVKLLPPSLSEHRGFAERFDAEIETLRRLAHPNIVTIHGFGEHDGLHFYAMEFVDGKSLDDELDNGRRYNWREVVQMGTQICAALKHAHDRGIIHRDLKPANLMMTDDGTVKLADFGIARLYGHTGMTAAGGPIGTATYMSPEQTDGSTVTARSDLYSLGCVFYALMSGRPPFQADNLQQMLRLQKSAIHEPIGSRVDGVPPELDLIVNKLLEKDPADRIPTAATLAKSLAAVEDAVNLREQTGEAAQPFIPISKPKTDEPKKTQQPESRSRIGANDAADATLDSVPVAPAPGSGGDETIASSEGDETIDSGGYELAEDPDATAAAKPKSPGSTVKLAGEVADDDVDDTISSSIYITRDEADAHDREVAEQRERERPFIIGSGTIMFIVFIIALTFATKWYMAPPTADDLVGRIEAQLGDEEPSDEDYLDAADALYELEKYHPDDPRVLSFAFVKQEAQLIREARRLKIKANRMYRRGAHSAIERTYLEAIAYLEVDPEITLMRLQAMVDLYNDPTVQKDEDIRKYLTLAIRQIDEMKEKAAEYSSEHLQLIQSRLVRAEELKAEDPAAAAAIARAIITLYGDKQWAQPLIIRAQTLLRE